MATFSVHCNSSTARFFYIADLFVGWKFQPVDRGYYIWGLKEKNKIWFLFFSYFNEKIS
jgi:hypothetical protein